MSAQSAEYIHPITNDKIVFVGRDEFVSFLRFCNPTALLNMKKQYEAKYPNFTITGIGDTIKIIKKRTENEQKTRNKD